MSASTTLRDHLRHEGPLCVVPNRLARCPRTYPSLQRTKRATRSSGPPLASRAPTRVHRRGDRSRRRDDEIGGLRRCCRRGDRRDGCDPGDRGQPRLVALVGVRPSAGRQRPRTDRGCSNDAAGLGSSAPGGRPCNAPSGTPAACKITSDRRRRGAHAARACSARGSDGASCQPLARFGGRGRWPPTSRCEPHPGWPAASSPDPERRRGRGSPGRLVCEAERRLDRLEALLDDAPSLVRLGTATSGT